MNQAPLDIYDLGLAEIEKGNQLPEEDIRAKLESIVLIKEKKHPQQRMLFLCWWAHLDSNQGPVETSQKPIITAKEARFQTSLL